MPVSRKRPTPYWRSECGRVVVYVGDCRVVMAGMDPTQFHAVVTDPPYGLEFMGKDWDAPWKGDGSVDARQRRAAEMSDPVKAKYLQHNTTYGTSDSRGYQAWFSDCAERMLRVSKPGAHLLSFGGTRMWHRMACAVEDSGWQVRDTLMWVYGSGFPKSHDVSKAIDKVLGSASEQIGEQFRGKPGGRFGNYGSEEMRGGYRYREKWLTTEPTTEEAREWSGWGTALKPAYEPIVLARKPAGGTVAECVLEHGTGGLNVDGCRVGTTGATVARRIHSKTSSGSGVYQFNSGEAGSESMRGGFTKQQADGRWPSNLIHDGSEEVEDLLPEGAARFFYTAKAGGDRDRPHARGSTVHPTVKPLDLMQYLVRLVCVRGGVVLDPFMGSGSTGCAAVLEGVRFVGVEQSEEYADVAVGRLNLALEQVGVVQDTPPTPKRVR